MCKQPLDPRITVVFTDFVWAKVRRLEARGEECWGGGGQRWRRAIRLVAMEKVAPRRYDEDAAVVKYSSRDASLDAAPPPPGGGADPGEGPGKIQGGMGRTWAKDPEEYLGVDPGRIQERGQGRYQGVDPRPILDHIQRHIPEARLKRRIQGRIQWCNEGQILEQIWKGRFRSSPKDLCLLISTRLVMCT